MSQQVMYPQQPAVMHGEVNPESPIHHPSDSQHSLIRSQNSSYAVAQLPVTPAETHSSVFPRSQSMPLSNDGGQIQSTNDSSLPSAVNQKLLSGPISSNSEGRSSVTVAKIEHLKNWRYLKENLQLSLNIYHIHNNILTFLSKFTVFQLLSVPNN